jgi:hypothetical protein
MLFGTTRGILVATAVVALLAACSSVPSTHVVLPAPTTVPQMTRLSQQTGAIASVITVSGDETVFTLEPGMSGTLTGKRLDSTAPGQQVALPFNSLALIYYTEPVTDRIPEQSKLPVKDRYPEPRKPGPSEAALSCEALDVELARAEALRWVARENGALPYSSGEKLELHAEHAAIDIGIALLVLAGGVGSTGDSVDGPKAGEWAVDDETFRWALSAIDERISGLLQIKEEKACTGHQSLKVDASDLQLWHALQSAGLEKSAAQPDEHAVLARRTATFDLLGPKDVMPFTAAIVLPAGDAGPVITGRANWFANVDLFGQGLWHVSAHLSELQEGTLVLTDQRVMMRVTSQGGVKLKTGENKVINIPYADIAAVSLERKALNCAVVITQRNGQVDSFQLVARVMVDRKKTEAAARTLQARLAVPPAAESIP